MEKLSAEELIQLIETVFPHFPEDRQLGILVDIPVNREMDHDRWKLRREIAREWVLILKENISRLKINDVLLVAYPDVGSNNADLPEYGYYLKNQLPEKAEELEKMGEKIDFKQIFSNNQLFLAPTEYSTTAPLKNAAKIFGFRAGTMPGFSPEMIPALRIDYEEVFRRVNILKEKLDPALRAEVKFRVDGKKEYKIEFDLRFRTSHLSSGRFPERGTAGNVPSGETYIVPYEGETGENTGTCGILPVQIKNEVLLFEVKDNRAVDVKGESGIRDIESLKAEQIHLEREPAYGNMAELGFGVLGDFGLKPIGEILLDEKLGFHVAFGRSDHFGGMVGPDDFSSPQEVIHLDRVYISSLQPRIMVESVRLGYEKNKTETIIKEGKYLVF
ncbi:MAG: hypothetical protein KAT17_06905 [Candidatus Aminicenantes bacterium]|nr:hypothetical protein [Candidatus Aminicenantes bacterium]